MQALTLDAVEYLPPVHAVQVVAPVPVPVLVIFPAAHVKQDATLKAVEYLPPTQPRHIRSVVVVPLAMTKCPG